MIEILDEKVESVPRADGDCKCNCSCQESLGEEGTGPVGADLATNANATYSASYYDFHG